jgi:hypothetical protein
VYVCVPALTVKLPVPAYGPVPPVPVTVTVAVPPLHAILVAVELAEGAVHSVTIILANAEHPFALVTVTEYVPEVETLIEAEVVLLLHR